MAAKMKTIVVLFIIVMTLLLEIQGAPAKAKDVRRERRGADDDNGYVYVPASAMEAESEGAFQSDIMMTDEQWASLWAMLGDNVQGNGGDAGRRRKKRKAVAFEQRRWPLKTVPYEISSESAGDIGVIMAGMKQWTDNTCIKFQSYSTDQVYTELRHDSRLSFQKDSRGCWSYLGRVFSGVQPISIGFGCEAPGTVAHEIGHAIGFHHEQSRPDRDDHVTIHWNNIQDGTEVNFAKYTTNEVTTHEIPYDPSSLMHYGTHYFSKNGLPTITTKDSSKLSLLGNREYLSFLDIKLANIIYKCNEECTAEIVCLNDGYQGPYCNCVCPPGYSGTFCQQNGDPVEPVGPTGECVHTFTAAVAEIKSVNYPNNYDDLLDCTYRIQGGPGSSITLVFNDFDFEEHVNCEYDYLNVRSGDRDLIGRTFCGSDLPSAFYTQNSEMILTFHSDPFVTGRGFRATYYINGPLVGNELTTILPTTTIQATTTTQMPTTTTQATTTTQMPTTTVEESGEFVGSCGGYFGALAGTMASPNYPADYSTNAVCFYTMVAPVGRRVELTIHHLDVEPSTQCSGDYVSVNPGSGVEVPMRLCGSQTPGGTFVSLQNWIQMRFRSDSAGTRSGFTASYRTIDII
ncbi:blastula protease 10 isoform X1 [Strongylocentrotus purpuratus]|uniref:Metalloendopeptidase n=1 Tax=Strongylocentrotus purpuratus TaxID=7668 RepID=A0A7M7LST3_STRPU|nr:blastula protease 10 isoform X1 [Strongylocentrotus purpuratus]